MKVTMLLADSAQAVGGKLYILGGGWSVCGPEPMPMGIGLKIEVPWDQTNMQHKGQLELLDEDGESVLVPTPVGEQPVDVQLDFEVGRPPGMKPGTPLDLVFAVNFPPLQIPPGHRYQWRLTLDGTQGDWTVGFTKLAPGQMPGMPGPTLPPG